MKGCFDCGMDAGLAGREGEREGDGVRRPLPRDESDHPADRDRYPFHESIAAKYGK